MCNLVKCFATVETEMEMSACIVDWCKQKKKALTAGASLWFSAVLSSSSVSPHDCTVLKFASQVGLYCLRSYLSNCVIAS